ncbi:MAG TPA: cytochrome c oxidase assembly protein [Chloroflexota bacterium]|nr:cytochrome c oxidase assembly protein [Chloroflexota bacterium]
MPAPRAEALLTQWNWDPSLILGILALAAGYAYAVGPYRRRRDLPPAGGGRIAAFAAAELLLVFALISPLDAVGDESLFSAHMVQHLLLAALWPVLILVALTPWMVRPVFTGPLRGPFRFLTHPVAAIALFNLDIYLWHFPYLYDLTLQNEGIHILEHLTFMAFGLLNFWPILSPIVEQRLSYPLQVLYLFADGMFMMVLGIVFTFSPLVFYTPYVSAPRLWGISPLSDQQLGGLIMWYPGNLPYGVLLVSAFYRWFDGREVGAGIQSPTIDPHLP